MNNYFYSCLRGKATLHVEGKPLKIIGKFKDDAAAKAACLAHFDKACKAADNFNRERPVALFI